MEPTRIGINGFGRIGRQVFKAITERHRTDLQVVAVNDLFAPEKLAHMLYWDTIYGPWHGHTIQAHSHRLNVDSKFISVFSEREPAKIPWSQQSVDIVIESTGRFTDATIARGHMEGNGVKKTVISAPAKNEDATLVLGVNADAYDPAKHHVISNASCTTNGLAPVAKVLNDTFGIEKGILTTIHSYTSSQSLVDASNNDLRDARAAAENIIPSATGTAKAVGLVIPELLGKFDGLADRVPTPTVSQIDFTALLSKKASKVQIHDAMQRAAWGPMKGILDVCTEPLVSSDFRGNPHSSIFSAVDTIVVEDLVKVISWYDNEWGYSCRVADLCNFLRQKGL